jgi:ribosomal protein S18 acetylase RimI-like enzyme
VALWLAPTANAAAYKLYRAFGFERMALLPQYYTDGRAALLMRRLRPR